MSSETDPETTAKESSSPSSGDDKPTKDEGGPQEATGAPARPTGRDRRKNPHLPFLDREKAAEAGRRGGATRAEQIRQRALETELAEAASREGAAPAAVAAVRAGASAADALVVLALEREAKKGDVQAARALLDWRKLDATQGAGIEALRLLELFSQLTTQQQAALRSMLLELLERGVGEEEAA